MRKVILSNLITLDGYFEGPNREIDWFVTGTDFFDYAKKQLFEVDTILFGRITYQQMAAFWPTPAAKDVDPAITEKMNSLQKIVFSKTLSTVEWNNSILIKGDFVEAINQLKQEPGKDMVIFGSGQIVSAFAKHNLIDEYRLIVNPVILGEGNTLFKNAGRQQLKLVDMKKLDSGSIILYYQ